MYLVQCDLFLHIATMDNEQSPSSGPRTRPQALKARDEIASTISTTEKVIENNRQILNKLNLILTKISAHRQSVNIFQTIASGGAVTGTALSFTPFFPAGVALLVGSALMSGGTTIKDIGVTRKMAKEATSIVESGVNDMRKLEKQLKSLSERIEEMGEEGGDSDVAFTVLLQSIIKKNLTGKADVGKAFLGISNMAAPAAFRLASAADIFPAFLGGAGAAIDVGVTIAGWVMENPTAEQVKKIINEIKVRVQELEEMKGRFIRAIATETRN